jgi:hypothetical protein
MYQNPFDLFIKMLDEIKKNCPQNNTKCTKRKHFLAQSSTFVVSFFTHSIFLVRIKLFQIIIKYDKNALLSLLVCAYKFLNQLMHVNKRTNSVLLQSSHFTRRM